MTYEAVHARPDGDSTVARLALTAGEYGYDGIVVRNHGDDPASYDPDDVAATYGVDVGTGVEVRAEDPSRASGFVGNHRSRTEVVVVHGGAPAINRFAVEQPAVDVLAHPMRGDGDVNHVLAREAAANGVRLELSLREVLRTTGGRRVEAIRGCRKLAELIEAYDVPFVVSADPRSHLDIRAPRELAALGEEIGIEADIVEDGLAEWGRLVAHNRERLGADFIAPGVRREVGMDDGGDGEDESDDGEDESEDGAAGDRSA